MGNKKTPGDVREFFMDGMTLQYYRRSIHNQAAPGEVPAAQQQCVYV
jgi:hypothetical protein